MKIRKCFPRRYVQEGGRFPRGYGLAWYDVMRRKAVCYPMPFNLFANWLRKLYYAISAPSLPELEKKLAKEYNRGAIAGMRRERKRWGEILDSQLKELDEKNKRLGWNHE